MRYLTSALLASTMLTSNISIAQADINVVASIKPIHSLVSAVMDGVGEPFLIIDGAGSPHTYALKPSQAEQLQDADLVFWVGHDLETFLEKPIEGVATKATSIALIDTHDVT
ncbi:metal ABC transporter solute-binding protein, Zn/Mn family, partial [Candidatus Puniceispirillum sp.]|uniref:metal ABC transporter solute-binding protein, Zn/Mn family n=1 Tax=Candidatus Puniceispirillum sp. TaxID=2026719 RepID=UPI003F69B3C5